MGRKNRYVVYIKPFCYYCDKEFNNESILHQHQKSKHFNCKACHKRFSTAPAIENHVIQVHKESLEFVSNAKKGRDRFELSVYGMDGVPMELINMKIEERINQKKRKLVKEGKLKIDTLDSNFKVKESRKVQPPSLNAPELFYRNPDSINIIKNKVINNSNTNSFNPMIAFGMGMGTGMPMMNPMMGGNPGFRFGPSNFPAPYNNLSGNLGINNNPMINNNSQVGEPVNGNNMGDIKQPNNNSNPNIDHNSNLNATHDLNLLNKFPNQPNQLKYPMPNNFPYMQGFNMNNINPHNFNSNFMQRPQFPNNNLNNNSFNTTNNGESNTNIAPPKFNIPLPSTNIPIPVPQESNPFPKDKELEEKVNRANHMYNFK